MTGVGASSEMGGRNKALACVNKARGVRRGKHLPARGVFGVGAGPRAFSGEVDPVHRRKCDENKVESWFDASGNSSSRPPGRLPSGTDRHAGAQALATTHHTWTSAMWRGEPVHR
jgi:hypothetical protein